ncbi:MAG: hypothetical protein J5698_07745 [Bacteroidaceae bacterium]|nr:hypothetical protein [Bacteroidaceae bacterium]
MKKIILLLFTCLLCATFAFAQNTYKSVLADGRNWRYEHLKPDNQRQEDGKEGYIKSDFVLKVGDNVSFDGHNCKEIISDGMDDRELYAYGYEENGKVMLYALIDNPAFYALFPMEQWVTLYDFNVQKGSHCQMGAFVCNDMIVSEVGQTEDRNHESHRFFALSDARNPAWPKRYVVDGVGSSFGLFEFENLIEDGSSSRFVGCYDGETCLFSAEDFKTLSTDIGTDPSVEEDIPYEFVSRDGLKAGIDIWFKTTWGGVVDGYYQSLDSISDKNIYISTHYDFRINGYYEDLNQYAIPIGRFDVGNYNLFLSSIDDAGVVPTMTHEIPFSVKENPISVPCGLVRVSGPNHTEREDKWDQNDTYSPYINVTLENDSLHITGWLYYTCCADHYCYYEIHDDSVFVETVEAGMEYACDCMNLHSVDFKIGPFNKERCTIETKESYLGSHTLHFDLTSIRNREKDETISVEFPYDLQGRPAVIPQKGILIKSGKKVLIK